MGDFDNIEQQVTFEPSQGREETTITINFVDDIVNEAQEGFLITIEVEEIDPTDQFTLVRNGVALVRITDNDRKSVWVYHNT